MFLVSAILVCGIFMHIADSAGLHQIDAVALKQIYTLNLTIITSYRSLQNSRLIIFLILKREKTQN